MLSKTRTKPRLAEAKTQIRDFGYVTLFPDSLGPANRERKPLSRARILHSHAVNRNVRVRQLYVGRMLLLPRGDRREWATSNVSRVI